MAWTSSRTIRNFALAMSTGLCLSISVFAATQSEDGGAGVFRLQSAELPTETTWGIGLYNHLLNISDGAAPFNSLLKNHSVLDTEGVVGSSATAHLWALSHTLSASISTHEFFEAHVALPMYTQLLDYGNRYDNVIGAIGDLRLGLKLALPIADDHFPLAVAVLLGGSIPTGSGVVPVPTRLEYVVADTSRIGASRSHADGTRRDDWHLGLAATLDLERSALEWPLQIHFNTGARKTSAIMAEDRDFYDILSAGIGFETQVVDWASIVGEYWHENRIETYNGNPKVDDISLGVAFHTPVGISILAGGAIGLNNDESSRYGFNDQNNLRRFNADVHSSADAQLILAVTYSSYIKSKDSDHDGVPDRMDKCPREPQGKNGKNGCPIKDRDGDGIPDNIDKCPDEAQGVFGTDGCPIKDRDSDGIPDDVDKCPEVAQGTGGADGCPIPDSDRDGICDPWVEQSGASAQFATECTGSDKCPNMPAGKNGVDGCPGRDTVVVVQKMLPVQQKTLVLQGVTFETGKAVFISGSSAALDDIADQLQKVPDVELEIAGHTDNRGGAALNLKLSKARAQAVANYLITKGVAASRLKVVGYGSNKPIATNGTSEGRAQNRRVEFNRLK